jgi:hypothetical protein
MVPVVHKLVPVFDINKAGCLRSIISCLSIQTHTAAQTGALIPPTVSSCSVSNIGYVFVSDADSVQIKLIKNLKGRVVGLPHLLRKPSHVRLPIFHVVENYIKHS